MRSGWPVRGVALASAALSMLAITGDARAFVNFEHEPGTDGCTEAASYFPEDQGPEATRARLRCRREQFARQLEEDRRRQEADSDEKRDQNIETWMKKQDIPARVLRRNAIDLFGSGGLASYGIATSWLLLPALEAEVWFGRRNVSQWVSTGYFQDSRSCLGGRFKWLVRSRGNLTPFASIGLADCWANVSHEPYGGGFLPAGSQGFAGPVVGTAAAHAATGTAGMAWMEKSGVRASVEYVYSYAFYTQATLDDVARTQDGTVRGVWQERLKSDRGGFRLQVGYAF